MKNQVTPYLIFDGQAIVALASYAEVFHGELANLRGS